MTSIDQLHVVGDRVLLRPDSGEERTEAGLILPAGVKAKDAVAGGRIVRVGPGHLTANPDYTEADAWAEREAVRYLPLQARPGDYALFLREKGVEIDLDGERLLVVPHAAILVLQRPTHPEDLGLD